MLALAVLALVIIDVVIIGTYMVVEGARNRLVAERVLNREHPQEITGVSITASLRDNDDA